MARPTQTRINTGPGFGPEVGRAPALQVVAPLNVQAAPSGAELLAQSLGIALDAATPILQDKIQRKAADSAALGRSDATMNKADAKRQAEDASYAVGVKRGMVDRAIVDFKSRAREFYENEFDKSMGTEILAAELDGIAKGMLQNYVGDADAARWITPEVLSTVNQITGAHDAELAGQFKEDRIASAASLMRDAIDNAQSIDPQEIMDRLRPILGGKAANEAYVEMVGALAVEKGAPELIDALIPEQWTDASGAKIPGPRSVDGLSAKLNQSRYYASAAARERDGELADAAKTEANQLAMALTLDAMRGIDPEPAIRLAVQQGMPISDETARAIKGSYRTERDDIREQILDPVRLARERVKMIENPKGYTTDDLVSFIGNNFSQGTEGVKQTETLIDNFVAAQNAANKVNDNPLAKTYKENLAKRFGPTPWEKLDPVSMDRYWQGMVAFDKALIETDDADKALEAAEKYFGKTPTVDIKPANNPVSDAIAFAEGRINQAQFVAAHKRDGSAQAIYAQIGKPGGLTREQAEKAIRALAGSPQ